MICESLRPHSDLRVGGGARSEAKQIESQAKANWHFTTAKARVKLKDLYPSL